MKFKEGRYPNRDDLDRISDRHPIIYRSSYHLNVFNSAGLKALRVDENTPDSPGGRIERDPITSKLTGRTFDMFAPLKRTAIEMLRKFMVFPLIRLRQLN